MYNDKEGVERSLSLIAPTFDVLELWILGLQGIIDKIKKEKSTLSEDELFLQSLWDKADEDRSGKLEFSEVLHLLESININIPTETIKKIFNEYDVDKSNFLEFNEFILLMNSLKKRYCYQK